MKTRRDRDTDGPCPGVSSGAGGRAEAAVTPAGQCDDRMMPRELEGHLESQPGAGKRLGIWKDVQSRGRWRGWRRKGVSPEEETLRAKGRDCHLEKASVSHSLPQGLNSWCSSKS